MRRKTGNRPLVNKIQQRKRLACAKNIDDSVEELHKIISSDCDQTPIRV